MFLAQGEYVELECLNTFSLSHGNVSGGTQIEIAHRFAGIGEPFGGEHSVVAHPGSCGEIKIKIKIKRKD